MKPPDPPRPMCGRRWPGRLLAMALGVLPLASPAQGPVDPSDPGGTMAAPQPPASASASAPQPWTPSVPEGPLPPYVHRGWYFGAGLGLGTATAGGAGKYYSLESLNGGRSVRPWTMDLRAGYTLRPDLRLGLGFGAVSSRSTDSGLESTAVVGHVGGELSWHPRGDGPFVRGELGLGFLQASGDMSLDASGREISLTGPAVTLGGGYLLGWHRLGIAHLAFSSDLSWSHYSSSGAGGQLAWSLAWTARVGVDVW